MGKTYVMNLVWSTFILLNGLLTNALVQICVEQTKDKNVDVNLLKPLTEQNVGDQTECVVWCLKNRSPQCKAAVYNKLGNCKLFSKSSPGSLTDDPGTTYFEMQEPCQLPSSNFQEPITSHKQPATQINIKSGVEVMQPTNTATTVSQVGCYGGQCTPGFSAQPRNGVKKHQPSMLPGLFQGYGVAPQSSSVPILPLTAAATEIPSTIPSPLSTMIATPLPPGSPAYLPTTTAQPPSIATPPPVPQQGGYYKPNDVGFLMNRQHGK